MKHRIIVEEQQFGPGATGDNRAFHLSIQVSKMEGVNYQKYNFFSPAQPADQGISSEHGMGAPQQVPILEQLHEAAGELGHNLAQQILTLEGVLQVSLLPFRIDVQKATCFEWEDISPKIKEFLLDAYKRKGIDKVGQELRRPEDWDETPQGRAARLQNVLMERYIKLMEKEQNKDRDDDWRNDDDDGK